MIFFLQIHYDRVSKDGLHSHREITVLYLPDLSNCLPSIDQWKSQWLAHKAAGAEKHKVFFIVLPLIFSSLGCFRKAQINNLIFVSEVEGKGCLTRYPDTY